MRALLHHPFQPQAQSWALRSSNPHFRSPPTSCLHYSQYLQVRLTKQFYTHALILPQLNAISRVVLRSLMVSSANRTVICKDTLALFAFKRHKPAHIRALAYTQFCQALQPTLFLSFCQIDAWLLWGFYMFKMSSIISDIFLLNLYFLIIFPSRFWNTHKALSHLNLQKGTFKVWQDYV